MGGTQESTRKGIQGTSQLLMENRNRILSIDIHTVIEYKYAVIGDG